MPASNVFCQEHHNEYLSLNSAYEQAKKEAEALGIFLVDIGYKAEEEGNRDPDEVRAYKTIGAKYVERLQSATQGKTEAIERFLHAGKPLHVWVRCPRP